jgi:hypothetical protein
VTDPIVTWNVTTINGKQYAVISTAEFRIPLDWDPSSNMFIAVGVPTGGFGNFPAIVKGDTGDTPTFDTTINLTVLDPDDPTADSASFTPLGSDVYQANLTLHSGPAGAAGTSVLDPAAYGTPASKKILIVNPTADGFIYQAQLVGDRFIPSVVNAVPAGNPLYTIAAVSVPAHAFDWRPSVSGHVIFTKTGTGNVTVDLIARLNDESAGNIVGRGAGPIDNVRVATDLSSGPPAGSADAYDKVLAGQAAVVYLRAERQTGTDTFTTTTATTHFKVKVEAVPGSGT